MLALGLALLAAPALAETATPLVETGWLQAHLDDPGMLIADVRDPDLPETTFANGHIAGAVSAPFASFGWQTASDGLPPADLLASALGSIGIGDATLVVLVADGINDFDFAKATRAYWVLTALGHASVSILDGGQIAWEAAGLPLITGSPEVLPARFTPPSGQGHGPDNGRGRGPSWHCHPDRRPLAR